jgi:hypothetical protein
VLIPEEQAVEGLQNIRQILANNSTIQYVIPMSLQVNYLLQKLGFYTSNKLFIQNSEPKTAGLISSTPYYQPKKTGTILKICGNTGDSQEVREALSHFFQVEILKKGRISRVCFTIVLLLKRYKI